MRRLFTVVSVVLISASLSFAQGLQDQDDHDDKAPIQSGYAVVTPVVVTTGATSGGTVATGNTTTGLVVFETFGLRHGDNDTTQAGVFPPDLTTNAVLFVDSEGRLAKNLGVAIVNPNSSNVNVTLTLRKGDGTVVTTSTLNVPSHQQVSKMVRDLFSTPSAIPSDITGSLTITSAGLPVSVIGLRFRDENFSTLPATNMSGDAGPIPNITATAGGGGAILLPQFAAGGGWATELVMINTSSSAMTVRVDLFTPAGTALITKLNGQSNSSFTGIHIPAGGVVVLAPRDPDGDDDF